MYKSSEGKKSELLRSKPLHGGVACGFCMGKQKLRTSALKLLYFNLYLHSSNVCIMPVFTRLVGTLLDTLYTSGNLIA